MEVQADAYIDDAYIGHGGQKIEMYQRLALIETTAQLDELEEELLDRYGKPTEPVRTLLKATRLRLCAQHLQITRISQKTAGLEMKWRNEARVPDPDAFEAVLKRRCRRLPGLKATFRFDLTGIPDILAYIDYILKACAKQEDRDA